jgi:hypothetical protein
VSNNEKNVAKGFPCDINFSCGFQANPTHLNTSIQHTFPEFLQRAMSESVPLIRYKENNNNSTNSNSAWEKNMFDHSEEKTEEAAILPERRGEWRGKSFYTQ